MNSLQQNRKAYIISFICTIVPILLLLLFQDQFENMYNPDNHLSLHLTLEMYSIFITFIIFIFGWKAFVHNPPTILVFIPFIFLAVGYFDFMHTLTYVGMPPLFIDGSIRVTSWFWVAARATESLCLAIILFYDEKTIRQVNRYTILFCTVLFFILISFIIYTSSSKVPLLVVEGTGPTPFKNFLEYCFCGLHFISLLLVLRKLKKTKNDFHIYIYLVFAFILLIIGGIQITLFKSVHDLVNIISHIYKAIGYTFIFMSFFYSNLHLTFVHKEKAEKNLVSTKGMLDSFFTHTPDSIALCDKNRKIVKVNAGFERLTHIYSKDAIGKPFITIFPHMQEELSLLIDGVLDDKRYIDYSLEADYPEPVRMLKTIYPIYNDDHIRFAVISRDITQEKLAKEKLEKMQNEINETLKEHQGVIIKFKKIDDYFVITLCSGKLLRNMNLAANEVVGTKLKENTFGEDGKIFYEHLKQAWKGNSLTFEYKRSGGIYAVTLKPIIQDSNVTEVIGSCIDITKLKKTEELLRKSEKLALVGELAAGIAHEIRNPLTTLKGFTQMFGSHVSEKEKPFVDLMLSELNRIELITNDFMILAKPQMIKYQQHDVKKIVEHVLTIIEPQATLNNIEIKRHFPIQPVTIICDENQLKQVFINLIKNALESMTKAGQLEVSMEQTQDNCVSIKIKDTGCGIPAHVINRLGEPFYTLKEKGTGLGLMVSFRIIEAHHGSIEFTSKENAGTTAEIILPAI
ncbi:MASE3 domain-containing protein [Metabacillus niabensis]|uniref:MASE3 domain-containing protein n=1 Tax=Metabacillus niabensis TaxID=324854 RepID=UPI001CFAB7CA|nr:MASE3 domain-containing protein [Metabacillus niabensis]